jgi:hypothetical protein
MRIITLRTICGILWLSVLPAATLAQYGSAPNNYYPDQYTGSTFTGTVTEVKDGQIKLTYSKKDKTDTFTGHLEANCSVPTVNGLGMTASDLTLGTVITAFFNGETKKVNGQKQKENVILAVSFEVWQGQKIADDKKKIYPCSTRHHLQFRAWN